MKDNSIQKNSRIIIAGSSITLLLLFLLSAFAFQQVGRHEYYKQQSENNRIRIQPIVPKRGLIYDRNLEILADNRLSFTVSIVPSEKQEGITAPRLAELLNTDTVFIEKRARQNYVSRYIPTAIRRGQGIDLISILEERGNEFPGIAYSAESVRRYDTNICAGAFIGYTGEVSADEINSEKYKDYRPGSLIGKKGVERTYDRQIRGIEGTKYIEVSAKGKISGEFTDRENIPHQPGDDILLTIDKALQEFIVASFDSVKCCGAVVAMNPNTGGILGIASFPNYDPNIFSGVIPPDVWNGIISDTNHPLLNRPIAGLYPPGSTTKLITAGAALEEGLIAAGSMFKPCYGGMQYGNRFIRCWKPEGHGKVNVYGSIEQSCDVYYYQIGNMLGVDTWAKYARGCGFDKRTGVDIPGEVEGIVPSTEYYNNLYGRGKWSRYLMLNLSIGQGEFTITPIQLAQFYCGLANNGIVYKPHFIKGFLKADGTIDEYQPEVSFKLPFKKKTLDILKIALDSVVQGVDGTAKGLINEYYKIAGKTGTAQNPHGDNHAWFSAFAPSDNPEIVVIAIVENAGHGSEEAAPLVGKIIDRFLRPEAYLVDSSLIIDSLKIEESAITLGEGEE